MSCWTSCRRPCLVHWQRLAGFPWGDSPREPTQFTEAIVSRPHNSSSLNERRYTCLTPPSCQIKQPSPHSYWKCASGPNTALSIRPTPRCASSSPRMASVKASNRDGGTYTWRSPSFCSRSGCGGLRKLESRANQRAHAVLGNPTQIAIAARV